MPRIPRLAAAFALAACAFMAFAIAAAAEPHHSLVQIRLDRQPAAAAHLRANAARYDIVFSKPGVEVHVAALPDDLARLRAAGIDVTVLQKDMETANAYPDKGMGFGAYHTLSESEAFVDSLRLLYPNVVSAKWSIGQTHQSRDIWAFRISDNPDVDEDEPEILIDAMHHAREIMAGEFVIMFAQHLAENYGVDPEITWLVDNRELYLVPMVNPDGIYYNEMINPDGGGMWRKNRRFIDVSTWGVDLNRNYPYKWGLDDSGSSPYPAEPDYRGPSAASEPETQAFMAFIASRDFRTHDSVHTYSNLLLYPWGYTTSPTADGAAFTAMATEMVRENGYTAGQPGAVLYDVNGGVFDWTYAEHGVFSFSTEIGTSSDGFWPAEARRRPLFEENVWPHIYLMRAAGPFVAAQDIVVSASAPAKSDSPAKSVAPGDAGELAFTVVNQSPIAGSAAVDLVVATDDPWIQLLEASRPVGALGPLGAIDFAASPIPFTIDAACPAGHAVRLALTTTMPEGDLTTQATFTVGQAPPILNEDFEGGLGGWTTTGAWGLTTENPHSGAVCLTDSPGGSYGNNSLTYATLVGVTQASRLGFWHRYDLESGWDYGRVEIAVDGGAWTTLATYNGVQNAWTYAELDLSPWAGGDIAIRFALQTDTSVVRDGWSIDDLVLLGDAGAAFAVVPPEPIAPLAGAVTGAEPVLTVANAVDPQGGDLVYGFRLYADALCTDLVATVDDLPAGAGQTAWTAPTLAAGNYWWRAWAGDGVQRTDLSPAVRFTVGTASAAPLDGILALRVLGNVTGGGARFELSLPAAAPVRLDLYDARGALVRRLHAGPLDGGVRTLAWDGRDRGGRAVASGVYFARAQVGARSLTGRVVVVR